jgi:hypothetical protein
MSQDVFDTCVIADGDDVPMCPISYEPLTKENAVRIQPPPPHKEGEEPNKTPCFTREALREWFKNEDEEGRGPTNPFTKEPIKQKWIKANLDERDCEPPIEEALPTPPTTTRKRKRGGKRKSKKSKRKTRKTRRK